MRFIRWADRSYSRRHVPCVQYGDGQSPCGNASNPDLLIPRCHTATHRRLVGSVGRDVPWFYHVITVCGATRFA